MDPLVSMLHYAVGAPPTLCLTVFDGETSETKNVEIAAPYAIVGRGTNCDIFLSGEAVSYRHLYLQVIGHRVAGIDLLSKTGVNFLGAKFHGWLKPNMPFRIGSHLLRLIDDGWSMDDDLKSPLEFKPRKEQHPELGVLPEVSLQLLNTSDKGKLFPINRIITLLGRDDRCRITCEDDQISKVHCSLLLLPSGLWAIDLLGRGGIQVHGQSCACAPLGQGSELQVGQYLLRANYPHLPSQEAAQALAAAQANAFAMSQATEQRAQVMSSAEFLTKNNRVLKVEIFNDTLIILPKGDIHDFSYQDIHIEVSRVNELISVHNFRNLIIDYSQVQLVGSIILDAVIAFCRNIKGRAVFCAAGPDMLASLMSANLTSVWPYFATRQEALHAIYHMTAVS